MKGIGYFQNLGNLLRNCLKFFGIFGEFFCGDFLKGFFGRNSLGGFFGRNYLVEINKELVFLSRF